MESTDPLRLREFQKEDLDPFHRNRNDPEAVRLAAFVGKVAVEWAEFEAHWERNLAAPGNQHRTVVLGDRVVGYVGVFLQDGESDVTFWFERACWGRGVATSALQRFLGIVDRRPIRARVAAENVGSLRVLAKCGFRITGTGRGFAVGRGEMTEEFRLVLDGGPSSDQARPQTDQMQGKAV